MAPRNEKIALIAALALSCFVAWNIWFGAPQFEQIAKTWSLDVPGYVELVFRYHKAFIALPALVMTAWLLPPLRRHRGWVCLGIGMLAVLLLASMWVPIFSAPAITG